MWITYQCFCFFKLTFAFSLLIRSTYTEINSFRVWKSTGASTFLISKVPLQIEHCHLCMKGRLELIVKSYYLKQSHGKPSKFRKKTTVSSKYNYSTQNIRLIVVFRIYFFILFIKTTHYIGCRDVVHRLRVSVKFYHFNTMFEIKGNVKCLLMYFHLKNTIKEYLFRKNIHFLMIIRKEAEIRDFSTFFEVFSNKTF